jgi:hypothetical protein
MRHRAPADTFMSIAVAIFLTTFMYAAAALQVRENSAMSRSHQYLQVYVGMGIPQRVANTLVTPTRAFVGTIEFTIGTIALMAVFMPRHRAGLLGVATGGTVILFGALMVGTWHAGLSMGSLKMWIQYPFLCCAIVTLYVLAILESRLRERPHRRRSRRVYRIVDRLY